MKGNNAIGNPSMILTRIGMACYHSVIGRLSHEYSAGKKGGAILIEPVSAVSESIGRKRIAL